MSDRRWSVMEPNQAVAELVELLDKYEGRRVRDRAVIKAAKEARAALDKWENAPLANGPELVEHVKARAVLYGLLDQWSE